MFKSEIAHELELAGLLPERDRRYYASAKMCECGTAEVCSPTRYCSFCGRANPDFSEAAFLDYVGSTVAEVLERSCHKDHWDIKPVMAEDEDYAREHPFCEDCGARIA